MADGKGITNEPVGLPTRCFICDRSDTRYIGDVKSRGTFRGKPIMVCKYCRAEYDDAMGQACSTGRKFRFVRNDELPIVSQAERVSSPLFRHATLRRLYKILLLLRERQIKRRKEVNWMADELTRKILKLPGQVAAIVRQTYVCMGDDCKLADDEALIRIRDLLEEIDPRILERKKKKRLS